ncbi:hypothetical protein Goshw_008306 [Gossypium schwendimanii]|uniref:MADS-box domain-containing protein n=2 Tax=Gossypium TaxID=3633 RepID=A0A7J9MGN6_GOSSC|nr:hypothetical protein [Gossypium schwendimanii]
MLFIIFSPTGKPYLFGHPSVHSATKRFLNPNQPLNETIYSPVEAFCKEFGTHNFNNGDFFGHDNYMEEKLIIGGNLLLISLTRGSSNNERNVL